MIELNKIEGTDIYEFSINGKIDKESVENLYNLFELKSEQHDKLKLLGTINEFPGFEDVKAFGKTMEMKGKAINNIAKYALLSDRNWVETLLPAGDFVSPGIPMKHFELDKRAEAIAWLKADVEKNYDEDDYLSKMDVKKIDANIYSFKVDGKIDEGGMTALYNILKNKNNEGKINLLGYYEDFDGFTSFKSFAKGIKADFASFGNLDKFAIVSDKKWIKTVAEIESKIIPGISMKGFGPEETKEALSWLKQH